MPWYETRREDETINMAETLNSINLNDANVDTFEKDIESVLEDETNEMAETLNIINLNDTIVNTFEKNIESINETIENININQTLLVNETLDDSIEFVIETLESFLSPEKNIIDTLNTFDESSPDMFMPTPEPINQRNLLHKTKQDSFQSRLYAEDREPHYFQSFLSTGSPSFHQQDDQDTLLQSTPRQLHPFEDTLPQSSKSTPPQFYPLLHNLNKNILGIKCALKMNN